MKRVSTLIALGLFLAAVGYAADDQDRRDRKRGESIEELSERLDLRFSYPDPTREQLWLHQQAAALLERTRSASGNRYRFDRLSKATDALLEASERILQARDQDECDEDERAETARALQNDYFRVQQAEYFAKLSKEKNGDEYTRHARSLYQQARRAYDRKLYECAETLGDAAGYVAQAIEALAQASIRNPEPPRIQ